MKKPKNRQKSHGNKKKAMEYMDTIKMDEKSKEKGGKKRTRKQSEENRRKSNQSSRKASKAYCTLSPDILLCFFSCFSSDFENREAVVSLWNVPTVITFLARVEEWSERGNQDKQEIVESTIQPKIFTCGPSVFVLYFIPN